jgi:hypothetical protein
MDISGLPAHLQPEQIVTKLAQVVMELPRTPTGRS